MTISIWKNGRKFIFCTADNTVMYLMWEEGDDLLKDFIGNFIKLMKEKEEWKWQLELALDFSDITYIKATFIAMQF
jgi:hypothetical protein